MYQSDQGNRIGDEADRHAQPREVQDNIACLPCDSHAASLGSGLAGGGALLNWRLLNPDRFRMAASRTHRLARQIVIALRAGKLGRIRPTHPTRPPEPCSIR
jgi:hypothetical protein